MKRKKQNQEQMDSIPSLIICQKKLRTRNIELVHSNAYPLFENLGEYLFVVDGFPVCGFNELTDAMLHLDNFMLKNS